MVSRIRDTAAPTAMDKTRVTNRLAAIRKSRGTAASLLAQRVNVSRQTIYAIEAGTYVPNTEVALNLARALEVSVEELFSLEDGTGEQPGSVSADLLAAGPVAGRQPVRLCRIGERLVGVPVSAAPYYLPEADGIVERTTRGGRASVSVFTGGEPDTPRRVVVAGCDPATSLLSRTVEKLSGVEVVCAPASSRLALAWLAQGKVHIAGTHLQEPETGEFNLPFIRHQFPGGGFRVVTFARWEEGLVVAAGNPKGISKIEDLARKNVAIVNREPGSGSRALLDERLAKAGIPVTRVRGYETVAFGHLAAAARVATGEADACVATRSAAHAFALDFFPLRTERYDLAMRRSTAALPAVEAFLDVLQRASVRRKLQLLAGYDTSVTGAEVA